MQGLATDLATESIAVRVVDPGWARTEMGGPDAMVSVEDAAAGIYARAWETSIESTGTFVDYNGTYRVLVTVHGRFIGREL